MLACSLLLLAVSTAPQGPNASVVINEFVYDDSGTDDREFVELYNATGVPQDLSNWVLESEDANGPNSAYVIPAGTILAPGGFWVLGSGSLLTVNQVVGLTDLWENSNESLTLRDSNKVIIDTLVYEHGKGTWATAQFEGEGIWGNHISVDGIETSWSRARDGLDTGNNRDFVMLPSTPGASNNLTGSLPYSNDFDSGGATPMWSGSWVDVELIDPTVIGNFNPSVIPASPQGGSAAVAWDPSGGGNANMFLAAVRGSVHIDALIYFDATLRPSGEYEAWSFGVGTTGSYFNTPDPGGSLGFTSNGNTGVNLTYVVTDSVAVVYLVDNNDGGWVPGAFTAPVVLGQLTLTAGQNDGWLRVSLDVAGDQVSATVGKPAAGGASLSGKIVPLPNTSTVFIGYREGLAINGNARPFTFDDISITCGAASLMFFGQGTPISSGTPEISASAAPVLGTTIDIQCKNLLPSLPAVLAMGIERATPLALGLLGGIPGSELLINQFASANVLTKATGVASQAQLIPNLPALCGVKVACQWIQLDLNLLGQYALPVGLSGGMLLNIGP